VLAGHPEVAEAAVVGAPSADWGETPVGFVVPANGARPDTDALRAWANDRLGKLQRLSRIVLVGELPRSSIGKVLKRDLVESLADGASSVS
jgi:acyl-CoA synthetase (AMP-forming)/AMP-acid ligase II